MSQVRSDPNKALREKPVGRKRSRILSRPRVAERIQSSKSSILTNDGSALRLQGIEELRKELEEAAGAKRLNLDPHSDNIYKKGRQPEKIIEDPSSEEIPEAQKEQLETEDNERRFQERPLLDNTGGVVKRHPSENRESIVTLRPPETRDIILEYPSSDVSEWSADSDETIDNDRRFQEHRSERSGEDAEKLAPEGKGKKYEENAKHYRKFTQDSACNTDLTGKHVESLLRERHGVSLNSVKRFTQDGSCNTDLTGKHLEKNFKDVHQVSLNTLAKSNISEGTRKVLNKESNTDRTGNDVDEVFAYTRRSHRDRPPLPFSRNSYSHASGERPSLMKRYVNEHKTLHRGDGISEHEDPEWPHKWREVEKESMNHSPSHDMRVKLTGPVGRRRRKQNQSKLDEIEGNIPDDTDHADTRKTDDNERTCLLSLCLQECCRFILRLLCLAPPRRV